MLPLALSIITMIFMNTAVAQDAIVFTAQQGHVSPDILEKFANLESKAEDLNTLMLDKMTIVVTNPESCASDTIYMGTCQTLTSATGARVTAVSSTTASTTGALPGASFFSRMQTFMDANGCAASAGWGLCTLDQLRQAQAWRVSGFGATDTASGWFLTIDSSYVTTGVGWSSDMTCSGMSTASPSTRLGAVVTVLSGGIQPETLRTCVESWPVLCCKVE